jgi:hypothetical protein
MVRSHGISIKTFTAESFSSLKPDEGVTAFASKRSWLKVSFSSLKPDEKVNRS